MENTFKGSVFGGFNRDDVIRYIEKTSLETKQQIEQQGQAYHETQRAHGFGAAEAGRSCCGGRGYARADERGTGVSLAERQQELEAG